MRIGPQPGKLSRKAEFIIGNLSGAGFLAYRVLAEGDSIGELVPKGIAVFAVINGLIWLTTRRKRVEEDG